MSLAVPAVYSIPMLLLVGWRGEPGKRDEPQHLHQGQATPGLLGMKRSVGISRDLVEKKKLIDSQLNVQYF